MAELHRAPFQLEVTVLDESSTRDGFLGLGLRHITYRARVDRVLLGEGLAPGDEIAVTSTVNYNMPGTAGSAGDRSSFSGPNGLPVVGDRARLFANGDAAHIKPVQPNGWQRMEPRAGYLLADADSGAAMQSLAAELEKCGITRKGFVGMMQPAPPYARSVEIWRGYETWQMHSAEVIVLAMAATPAGPRAAPALEDMSMGLAFAAIGPGACEMARPAADDASEATHGRVLLWGRFTAAPGVDMLCVPLFWAREIPRVATGRREFDEDGRGKWVDLPDLSLPPQRVLCCMYTLQQVQGDPQLRGLLMRGMQWLATGL